MTLHKLAAGSGYTYLTRQVAAHDRAERSQVGSLLTTRRRASPRVAGWAAASPVSTSPTATPSPKSR